MTSACNLPEDVLCGCCDGLTQQTPQHITNRLSLSAVSYRTGTYSTFLGSMLAALSDPDLPALSRLRTRDSSDFTIALIDAWAVTLDVLTFYQERFVNEAFLRTAIDQRSVFELARLVGYVPSPGVSASALLAFTLFSATGSPDNVLIRAGTRVQSIPGPDQKPQIFETSSDLTAVIALNSIPAQTHLPWHLNPGDTSTWITGAANNISVGDALLFIASWSGRPAPNGPADLRYVSRVNIDPSSGNTHIWWNAAVTDTAKTSTADIALYIFRKKAALFGANAIDPNLLPPDTLKNIAGHPVSSSALEFLPAISFKGRSNAVLPFQILAKTGITAITPGIAPLEDVPPPDWSFIADADDVVYLDSPIRGLNPSGTLPNQLQFLALTIPGSAAIFSVISASESNPNRYALSAKTSKLTLAPTFATASGSSASSLTNFIANTRSTTAYASSDLLIPATLPRTDWGAAGAFRLAPGMIVPVHGTSLAVVGGQSITAQQPIGISGKKVRLQVIDASGARFSPAASSANLNVSSNQIFLTDAFPPTIDPAGILLWPVSTVSGVAGTLAAPAASLTLLPADMNDPLATEAALVTVVAVAGDNTTLTLGSALSGMYDATTVTVNANAVESTHGETVHEILGNGDGTNSALQFTLKQTPITYVTAAKGNGTQSTLQVWVNNLQWHEDPNILAAGPADRVFTSRVSPGASRTVQFGDGIKGARTPTGQMNIRAADRTGIGSAGMVDSGQLSQPLDRPQGVKSVVNPSPASGAADPATPDDCRQSAPLPTLTIGRIVSLEDYQNFAINFAGIAKALATWTWFGVRRGVLLTVAGANGAVLRGDDPVVLKLIAAIKAGGNPFIPLQVVPFVPVLFRIGASIKVDSFDYNSGQILAQVWSKLQAAFAFPQRRLAEQVVASEIIELIQNTPGVIATQLSALHLSAKSAPGVPPTILCASGPLPPLGAQMLLLDPASRGTIGARS